MERERRKSPVTFSAPAQGARHRARDRTHEVTPSGAHELRGKTSIRQVPLKDPKRWRYIHDNKRTYSCGTSSGILEGDNRETQRPLGPSPYHSSALILTVGFWRKYWFRLVFPCRGTSPRAILPVSLQSLFILLHEKKQRLILLPSLG